MIYSGIAESRSGKKVPVFSSGKPSASKYNPEKEAETFASSVKKSDFFAVLGLCGGYHISALRKKYPASKILVLENSEDEILFLGKNIEECGKLLNDRNIIFASIAETRLSVLRNYLPVLYRNFSLVEHRAWTEENSDKIEKIRLEIKETLEEIAGDFSTQAKFGKIWQHNIIKNLKAASEIKAGLDETLRKISLKKIAQEKTAAIIAAGPSLDLKTEYLRENRENLFIISTDTAFSSLEKHRIFCDAVVSIDGQTVSRTHFSGTTDSRTLFVFDLAANPFSARKAAENRNPLIFTSSSHPLSQYAELTQSPQERKCFPELNPGAGTVTLSALDFALKTGFKDILVFGADFSYADGKSYAKGTYLENLFQRESLKTESLENRFQRIFFRSKLAELPYSQNVKNPEKGKHNSNEKRFTTDTLESYRKSLLRFFDENSLEHDFSDSVYRISAKKEKTEKDGFCFQDLHKTPLFDFEKFKRKLKNDIAETDTENSPEELFSLPVVKSVLPYISHIFLSGKAESKEGQDFQNALKLAFTDITRYTF